MIIARRFNAGSEAGFDIVPKGRLNGAHVLCQFLFPWRVQHQRAPPPDHAPASGETLAVYGAHRATA
jgi:hypothetical protein